MGHKLPRNVRRVGDRYRAAMDISGKRVVGPLRDDPEVAADDAAEMRRQRRKRRSTDPTLADGFDALLLDLERTGARPDTVTYYRNAWRVVTGPHGWGESFPLREVSVAQAERFATKRIATGKVSARTVWRKELETLRRVLRLAHRAGLIDSDPLAKLQTPRTRGGRFGVLTRQRVLDLVAAIRDSGQGRPAIRERDALTVELVFLTGMRRAEVARLRPMDIDMDAGQLHVDGKTAGRVLPITDRLRQVLASLIGDKPATRPIVGSVDLIERIFSRWQKRLGEPLLTPHVLRHSAATAAVDAGVPQMVLAELLGHSDVRQTARYYHGRTEVHRDALQAIQGARDASGSRRHADSRRRWESSRRSSESASRDSSHSPTADSDTRQPRAETR